MPGNPGGVSFAADQVVLLDRHDRRERIADDDDAQAVVERRARHAGGGIGATCGETETVASNTNPDTSPRRAILTHHLTIFFPALTPPAAPQSDPGTPHTPAIPPAMPSASASTRHCRRTSLPRAPTAVLMPMSRALGHGHEHDVHDADAADERPSFRPPLRARAHQRRCEARRRVT